MHGELETALREEANANRDRLLSQLDEVQRLSKIVDGLSLLTKADAGLITLKQEPVRLDELVRDGFADAKFWPNRSHQNRTPTVRRSFPFRRPASTAAIAVEPDGQRHQIQSSAGNGHHRLAPQREICELKISNTGRASRSNCKTACSIVFFAAMPRTAIRSTAVDSA